LERGRFDERFAAAAAQLGANNTAQRLAGVYALGALADENTARRQQCIDLLCSYIRLPYDPSAALLRTVVSEHTWPVGAATGKEQRTFESLPNDRNVRLAIIALIRTHLRPQAKVSWSAYDFDFTGALFDFADFSGAEFSRSEVSFVGARFSDGEVRFDGTRFSGSVVSFKHATFSGSTEVNFKNATFSGGEASFDWATLSGDLVNFENVVFSGGRATFNLRTKFSGSEITFAGATFSHATVQFHGAEFSGRVSFEGAKFYGSELGPGSFDGAVRFNGARFSGGNYVNFDNAEFAGGRVWFGNVFFGDGAFFGRGTFSGATVIFSSTTFTQGIGFNESEFSGGKVFLAVTLPPGRRIDFSGSKFTGGEVISDAQDEQIVGDEGQVIRRSLGRGTGDGDGASSIGK
jgi:uncharacterized protein YjbI with pentapeptide repeats